MKGKADEAAWRAYCAWIDKIKATTQYKSGAAIAKAAGLEHASTVNRPYNGAVGVPKRQTLDAIAKGTGVPLSIGVLTGGELSTGVVSKKFTISSQPEGAGSTSPQARKMLEREQLTLNLLTGMPEDRFMLVIEEAVKQREAAASQASAANPLRGRKTS